MSDLPKWVRDHVERYSAARLDGRLVGSTDKLVEALEIAWATLMKVHYATVDPKTTTQHCMDSADEAMRRIEELGK